MITLLYIENIFHANKTFYCLYPNLEGIKDALCKRLILVRTVEPCAQAWWSWKYILCERWCKAQALALVNEATEALAKQEAW